MLYCLVDVVVYLFQQRQTKHAITTWSNEFYKTGQPEGQMPIMLATYNTDYLLRV